MKAFVPVMVDVIEIGDWSVRHCDGQTPPCWVVEHVSGSLAVSVGGNWDRFESIEFPTWESAQRIANLLNTIEWELDE